MLRRFNRSVIISPHLAGMASPIDLTSSPDEGKASVCRLFISDHAECCLKHGIHSFSAAAETSCKGPRLATHHSHSIANNLVRKLLAASCEGEQLS